MSATKLNIQTTEGAFTWSVGENRSLDEFARFLCAAVQWPPPRAAIDEFAAVPPRAATATAAAASHLCAWYA